MATEPIKPLKDPYETDYNKLGGGITGGFRAVAGKVGNMLTNAGLTDQNLQRADLAKQDAGLSTSTGAPITPQAQAQAQANIDSIGTKRPPEIITPDDPRAKALDTTSARTTTLTEPPATVGIGHNPDIKPPTQSLVRTPEAIAADNAPPPNYGTFQVEGGKARRVLGSLTKKDVGFYRNEEDRVKSVAESNARDVLTTDQRNQEKAATMRADATFLSQQLSRGPSSRATFDESFVGKPDDSNPSYRSAMRARENRVAQEQQTRAHIAQLNGDAAYISGQAPVGGQAYTNQGIAGDVAKSTIAKQLAEANAENATAAAGGKGMRGKGTAKDAADQAVEEAVKLAGADPANIPDAVGMAANIRAGGTKAAYVIPDDQGNPQTYTGVLTPQQQATMEADAKAEAEIAKRKSSIFVLGRAKNKLTGVTEELKQAAQQRRDKARRMSMTPDQTIVAKK